VTISFDHSARWNETQTEQRLPGVTVSRVLAAVIG
jgi:hypothetical protein